MTEIARKYAGFDTFLRDWSTVRNLPGGFQCLAPAAPSDGIIAVLRLLASRLCRLRMRRFLWERISIQSKTCLSLLDLHTSACPSRWRNRFALLLQYQNIFPFPHRYRRPGISFTLR
jgi:hypothetical protein